MELKYCVLVLQVKIYDLKLEVSIRYAPKLTVVLGSALIKSRERWQEKPTWVSSH